MIRLVTSLLERLCQEGLPILPPVMKGTGIERPAQIAGAVTASFMDSLIFPAIPNLDSFVQTERRHATKSRFK